MTARILVVDDVEANVKLLEIKLKQEYYEVLTANCGTQAIEVANQEKPDIILLDVMMPDMDGYETCKRLKQSPETEHIPIVMVTALSEVKDRVKGLEAGADDFLTKPVDDVALMARIRSLVRLKMVTDELRIRNQTGLEFGAISDEKKQVGNEIEKGKIIIIDDDIVESKQLKNQMQRPENIVDITTDPEEGLNQSKANNYDLIIVSTQLCDADGLRLCSQLRSQAETRHTPILILIDEEEKNLMVKGLEIGVNDYLMTPIDGNELVARVNTQVRKKHFQDDLKANYEESVSMAVKDGLTGLYNRRYFDVHYSNMVSQAKQQRKTLALMMLDIDHFKQVNDTYGHQAGDEILRKISNRIEECVRNTDLVARYGGEEFVVVMNSANKEIASDIAERVRQFVEITPVRAQGESGEQEIPVTISIGLALLEFADTSDAVLNRADKALYEAKEGGRNKVVVKGE